MSEPITLKPATPSALMACLSRLNIVVQTHTHAPLMTVKESQSLRGEIAGLHSKNLFLKEKNQNLWLIVCEEGRVIDLKTLRKHIKSTNLSFARPETLQQVLGVQPGSVTPFSVMNDTDDKVQVVLDKTLADATAVNFHPLTNTQTLTISGPDLVLFLKAHHHDPIFVDFSQI